MYVWMYVCMYLWMHECSKLCKYVMCIHVYIYVSNYLRMNYIHVLNIYYIYVCMNVSIYVWIWYFHASMCVFVMHIWKIGLRYMCIYVYIFVRNILVSPIGSASWKRKGKECHRRTGDYQLICSLLYLMLYQ